MSHYTAIKTKYKNFSLLKKSINKLTYPYSEHKKNIEVYLIPSINLSSALYEKNFVNHLSFQLNDTKYDIVSDFQTWTKKDLLTLFLKKLELNYSYSEVVNQAIELGFTRSKKIFESKQNNKFVFQRCVEVI